MENYKVISKDILLIKGNNALAATYCYALIKKYENYQTNISTLTEDNISKFANISLRTAQRIVSLFKEIKGNLFLDIETKQVSRDKRINSYIFPKQFNSYFYIYDEYFLQPLKDIAENDQTNCKGLLLRLKALCYGDSNFIYFNKKELAAKLGISRPTLNKYLDMLLDAKHVRIVDNGYFICNPLIIPDYIKDDVYTFNYHCIYYYLLYKGIIPPIREEKADRLLSIDYFYTDKTYSKVEVKNKDNYYLPLAINKRLQNVPDNVNWEYLTKALCNLSGQYKKREKKELTFTL